MPMCSINRLLCERVSMPGPNRRTKRQAGDYRLPHVHILLSWGSTGQFGTSYSAAGAPPEVDVGVCGAAPCTACCYWSAHRSKTPRTRHFPGIAEAWIISAVDQLAWPQSGIELVEAHDFAWRHAAGEMRRHELTRMIEACGGDQLRQSVECRSMEVLHPHPFVVNHQSTPAAGVLRSHADRASFGMAALGLDAAEREHERALIESPNRIRAQGAEAHGRDIEYRCIIGPRAIRSTNFDAERRGCERPRHDRMADPLEPLRIDVVLRPERTLVQDHLGALIDHRPLVAAERPAVFLVFKEILTHLGSYLFEQETQMG